MIQSVIGEIFNEGLYIETSMSIKLSNDSKRYVGM